MYLRAGRARELPETYPTPFETAMALADDVVAHLEHYRLRGRCVVKVSSAHIRHLLARQGFDVERHRQAVGGYTATVFVYLDHILEKRGFKLIEKRNTSYSTSHYYRIPGCLG